MTEAEERQAVVTEALSWIRTPYHHNARLKGVGVDCAMLLAEVYSAAGVVPPVASRYYPRDWHLHRDEERYLSEVLLHAHEIEGPPKPGDVVLFKFGRCFSHGAIVIEWPRILHAYVNIGCQLEDVDRAAWLNFVGKGQNIARERKFLSLWPKTPAEPDRAENASTGAEGGI